MTLFLNLIKYSKFHTAYFWLYCHILMALKIRFTPILIMKPECG